MQGDGSEPCGHSCKEAYEAGRRDEWLKQIALVEAHKARFETMKDILVCISGPKEVGEIERLDEILMSAVRRAWVEQDA